MQQFTIEGMSCDSCVDKIEDALKIISNIEEVEVDLSKRSLQIISDKSFNADELNGILAPLEKYRVLNSPKRHVWTELRPLWVVLSYIAGLVLLRELLSGSFEAMRMVSTYMAAFFILFSLFKVLNLSSFADAFQTYDIVAKKFRIYAYMYVFFEIAFGVAMLAIPQSPFVNALVLLVMSVSFLGVYQALRKKNAIQCACLGTLFRLPMTKVTLIENASMIVMSFFMLMKGVKS